MPAPTTATDQAIADAAAHLRAGRLVAFPTETVYGLGADATNSEAVAQIFAAKGRPRFNPLIVHVHDAAQAAEYVTFTPLAHRLADAFWPGPLTLVLDQRGPSSLSDLVTGGLTSVAVRAPDHPIARALLAATARPLAAPSANRSGRISPTQAAHVAADFPGHEPAMILDGGPTAHGLESTIVDARSDLPILLRPGAVPVETIAAALGVSVLRTEADAQRPNAPGQLTSHYAPRAAVRLNATDVQPGEALLAFGPDVPAGVGDMINLSPSGNLTEAAVNLFAALRMLDAGGARTIAVMPVPDTGLGEAINDRLHRAAAPRPADSTLD
ncbi:L-threonylcarbamoyladenylate synthase [Hyphomicrobium sp. D-2]|uniref:L-threonylcarbamoyladenylate synthase n=1 Tax=Hyphomicrobium sp. D-2 TaxID=3041621 RepID=UPI0024538242|nr:L-threonylcarbamoyladenylate synthase [Hyphomicrobium sp. D-2]MDH4980865.1 L-threonylcarbamoyladenylate synthase [Hyphomicrobium sp. D-2]